MGCLWGAFGVPRQPGHLQLLVGDAWREQSQVAGPGKHLGKQVARGAA